MFSTHPNEQETCQIANCEHRTSIADRIAADQNDNQQQCKKTTKHGRVNISSVKCFLLMASVSKQNQMASRIVLRLASHLESNPEGMTKNQRSDLLNRDEDEIEFAAQQRATSPKNKITVGWYHRTNKARADPMDSKVISLMEYSIYYRWMNLWRELRRPVSAFCFRDHRGRQLNSEMVICRNKSEAINANQKLEGRTVPTEDEKQRFSTDIHWEDNVTLSK